MQAALALEHPPLAFPDLQTYLLYRHLARLPLM
jgi:hypothetical protein